MVNTLRINCLKTFVTTFGHLEESLLSAQEGNSILFYQSTHLTEAVKFIMHFVHIAKGIRGFLDRVIKWIFE